MNWFLTIIPTLQKMSSVEAAMLTAMVIFFIYRGGVNLLPKLKKTDQKSKDAKDLFAVHQNCKNYSSLLIILERAMQDASDIMHIRYIETIYDQMNLAEESWRRIRMILRQGFVENLDEDLEDGLKQDAKVCYNLVLDKIGKDLIGLLRKWVKRNHFTEKSDLEFQSYITERLRDLTEFFSIAIQDVYVPEIMKFDLERLRNFNLEKLMPEIGKEIVSFFTKARIIAAEKEKKIDKIKNRIPK